MLNFKVDNYIKYFPKYKKNVEAAAKLMDTLNLVGCFSDELITKFWRRINLTLDNIISGEKHDFKKDIENFHNIYEPYCIFSDEFKHYLNSSFLTILTEQNEKRKIKKNK